MTQLDKLKDRAKTLEAKDPRAAVDAWLEVLKLQEAEGEANPDLGLYNRIGDLYLKLRDPGAAADYYDRAVDKYAELGFHNNAIAMCNKVLRNAPARQAPYLKLARLYAAKGFLAEAKQNFVEYAERMQKAGKIEQAFAALRTVTDLSPEADGLRHMLEEHLKMYGDVQRRPSSASRPAAPPAEPPGELTKSGKRKTSSLVFLDLDEPAKPRGDERKSAGTPAPQRGAAPAKPAPAPPPPAPPKAPPAPPKMVSVPDEEDEDDVDDDGLAIERTSLSEDAGGSSGSLLEGFETTSADFGDVREAAPDVPSIREEPSVDDVEPAAGFEPTAPLDVGAGNLDLVSSELTVEEPPARVPSKPTPPPQAPRPAMKPVAPKAPPPPVVAKPAKPAEKPPEPPRRRTQVEIPPLELEPDFESTTKAGHHVDDQPLALEPDVDTDWVETEDDSATVPSSGFIDLGVDGIVNQEKGALMFSGIEDAPAAPSIEALEERVADNPDDPELHQSLGEALVEAGQRDRGIEELDIATNGFESVGNLQQARDLVDEILRLDPNSVRHRQKAVEFSFKAGDKVKLIDAYLELADTLLRTDLPEKARAVYQRVAEHDPGNPRVKAALAMFAPAAPAPVAPAAKGKEGRVPAKDAKMTVRDSTVDTGDFVDLSALVLDEDHADRDTRMKVQDEEPTGDEEKDFQEMLARFKQGIDENIDEADFQSHYDLGVAFKEMGLLDEAISEFQRALRAPEGKLRTSEALGVCFFEKGAFGVTESILRRGLELPASGDQERLGILYWLGRALEEQGKAQEARELYGRVFAVDIRFRDVGERVKALAKVR
jgi:tetratricopeptide (TPR) repeat protein